MPDPLPRIVTQIVTQNVVNLYVEPTATAELASQAILGETVLAAQEENGFTRVTTPDRYESWIDSRLLTPPGADTDFLFLSVATLLADLYADPDVHSEIRTKLTVGARVAVARRPEVGPWVPVLLPDGQAGYLHRVSLNQVSLDPVFGGLENLSSSVGAGISRQDLISALGVSCAEAARRLVGTPYLWGGTTPFGIDCSGLTQLVYKISGIQLLRDAALQFADRRFARVEEGHSLEAAILDPGDLIAFSRREDKRPTHIGLALGDGRFLHARGGRGVRVDDCGSEEYSRTYLGAVRLSPDTDFSVQSA